MVKSKKQTTNEERADIYKKFRQLQATIHLASINVRQVAAQDYWA